MTPQLARRRPQRIATLAAVLLGGTSLAIISLHPAFADDQSLNATAKVQQVFRPIQSFAPLVKIVKPAVVSVTVHLKVHTVADHQPQDMNGIPFPFPFPFPFPQQQQQQAVEAKGSGFFISSKGYLVTNNHVVKNAKSIFVTLSDGERLKATIVGTDPSTDLAVLKVTRSKPFPYLELGDSASVTPGQWVIAIGNPFGLAETVTTGVVSALDRDIGDGQYDSFIQVDAPINEGNSGGPLLNQKGQVIGVNTAILTPTGGSVGIGFAITSDMVKRISAELIKYHHVTRGFIGVQIQEVSPEMAAAMNLPSHDGHTNGALIAETVPNGPAAKAGLKAGDVITKVNGKIVHSTRDLALAVSEVKPGDDVNVTFERDGHEKTASIKVETFPKNADAAFNPNAPSSSNISSKAELGLSLESLTPALHQQLGIPMNEQGAVINHVNADSPADQAGLRDGDVIVGVGSAAVTSPADAESAIKAAESKKAKAVALRIMRNGQSIFVAVPLPDAKK
jgi:serine protease Do